MSIIASFEPVVGPDARVLILGTMPGGASLAASQYYAHPRNAFWPILGRTLGFAPDAPYDQRLAALHCAHIALWDVLAHCVRTSSLDADIEPGSARANNVAALLRRHPGISTLCFNGAAAQNLFRKLVLPSLGDFAGRTVRLPSTSPAHAAMAFNDKLTQWHVALREAGVAG